MVFSKRVRKCCSSNELLYALTLTLAISYIIVMLAAVFYFPRCTGGLQCMECFSEEHCVSPDIVRCSHDAVERFGRSFQQSFEVDDSKTSFVCAYTRDERKEAEILSAGCFLQEHMPLLKPELCKECYYCNRSQCNTMFETPKNRKLFDQPYRRTSEEILLKCPGF